MEKAKERSQRKPTSLEKNNSDNLTRADIEYPDVFMKLKQSFGDDSVKPEWDVAKESGDWLQHNTNLYVPRIDFAVKPFNTDRNRELNIENIRTSYDTRNRLINMLVQKDTSNAHAFDSNQNMNPRCFLAIEIENKTSRKHRLGSIINASALAKVGIILGEKEEVKTSLINLRNYLGKLNEYQKNNVAVHNTVILTKDEFLEILGSDLQEI